jgi:hypothetical protein
VGALAAGEDAHGCWPAVELVPGPPVAQQGGELGDVGFLDPALAVAAAAVTAGVPGAALADLAVGVDGDLPGALGRLSDASMCVKGLPGTVALRLR